MMQRASRYIRIPPFTSRWHHSRNAVVLPTRRFNAAGGLGNQSLPVIHLRHQHSAIENLPRVARASLWKSLVPTFLRRKRQPSRDSVPKQTNPATFFIIIFLLIGSQAIQSIALRHEFTAFTRHADVRIALLREVIQRVQQGEEVDVEGILGTGNKAMEKEWEDALRDIERDDLRWQSKSRQRKGGDKKEESTNDNVLEDDSRRELQHEQFEEAEKYGGSAKKSRDHTQRLKANSVETAFY